MRPLGSRLSVLLGVWTVCTVGPPLSYVVGGPFDGEPTTLGVALAVGLFIAGTVVGRSGIGQLSDPAERFRDGIELGSLLGLAGIVMFVSLPVSLVDGLVAAVPFGIGGVVGFFIGFLVGYVADTAIVDRSRTTTTHHLVWSATKRPDAVWVRTMRVGGAIVALAVAALVETAGGRLLALFWALVGLLQIGLLVQSQRRRRYELTDAGLITAFGHLPWEQFDGYECTDKALLLYGNVWPFGTIAYDRESVDDLAAVLDALDRYLPEQEGAHQDPSVVDGFRELLSS